MMNRAVIGVGSNVEPHKNIELARSILAKELRFIAQSRFVSTAPIGHTDQPHFLNGAYLVDTPYDLNNFRSYLKKLEIRCGRTQSADKYAPRTIDMDIVVWNGIVIHNDFYERDFLRDAVLELVPQLHY